jgi:hypothetical protein
VGAPRPRPDARSHPRRDAHAGLVRPESPVTRARSTRRRGRFRSTCSSTSCSHGSRPHARRAAAHARPGASR